MGTKATRKLLSIIIAVVIAIATVCASAASVVGITFASRGFLEKHIVTDAVVEECRNQLKAKYAVLEEESGIPARVFETAIENYDIKENLTLAVSYVFGDEASELYSKERVNYFYGLCEEYARGNSIAFDKNDLLVTADKAARIYSQTVGIHNADSMVEYISAFRQNCNKATSASLVVIVACTVLLIIMYKKRENAVSFLVSGISGGGVALVFGAIISLVARVGNGFAVSPAVYQQAFAGMARLYLLYVIIVGVVLVAFASLVQYLLSKNKKLPKLMSSNEIVKALKSRDYKKKSE